MPDDKQKPAKKSSIFSNDTYYGFAAYTRDDDGKWRLHFNWLRIVLILVVLSIVGYFGLAAKRYFNDKYSIGLESTTFWEMVVYPFDVKTRVDHRRQIGEMYIEKARKAKTPMEVINNVRTGLAYAPYNPDGRIYFSYVLFYQRFVKEAIEFLASGLPSGIDHKDYVRYFVQRCLETASDDVLVRATADNIDSPKITEENRMLLAVGAVQACLLRGRFSQARELMTKYKLNNTLTGSVLFAQILWESGEQKKAVDLLRQVVDKSEWNIQVVLLYSLYLANSGEKTMARSVLEQAASRRNSPEALVRMLTILDEKSDADFRKKLIDNFIKTFSKDSSALLMLSQYATDSNNFALMERIYKHAREEALVDLPSFEMHYIESLTASGRAKDAISYLDKLTTGNIAWVEQNRTTLDCLRTMAYYRDGQDSLGKINLERSLKDRAITVPQLVLMGRRLTDMGKIEEGKSAYEAAYFVENYNHQALLALVNYALHKHDAATLLRYLPELLETRRPPRQVLERVYRFLNSDRMLFVQESTRYQRRIEEILASREGIEAQEDGQGKPVKNTFQIK